jgi:CheY-like chemotaxis protein
MLLGRRSRAGPPRVLIIDDNLLVAVKVDQMVRELGYEVSGVAGTIASARKELGKRGFDAVLLDLHLPGPASPEIGDLLLELRVPFAFVTDHGGALEPRHGKVPLLPQPFTPAQLSAVLEILVGPGSSGSEIFKIA